MPVPESFTRRRVLGSGIAVGTAAIAAGHLGMASAQDGSATPESTPTAPSGTQPDGTWLFVDDLGTEIRLASAPRRIVAELSAAASLWDLGIRPVGVFGITATQDGSLEIAAGRVDLGSVVNLGEGFDDFDQERLVALEPDLVITSLYGTRVCRINVDAIPQIAALAPIAGINVSGVSVVDIIGRYVELAAAHGADTASGNAASARAAFDASAQAVPAAAAANPDLSILYVTGASDVYYVGNAMAAGDLIYFRQLGVNIPQTEETVDYWESDSWEETDKYPTDVSQMDRRAVRLTYEQMLERETFALLPPRRRRSDRHLGRRVRQQLSGFHPGARPLRRDAPDLRRIDRLAPGVTAGPVPRSLPEPESGRLLRLVTAVGGRNDRWYTPPVGRCPSG